MGIEARVYDLEIELVEPMLGTAPKNKEVYAAYIASKAPKADLGDEEVETAEDLEAKEAAGWTGFHSDENGIFLYDYAIKGFLKESGNILKDALEIKGLRRKIADTVFVSPRRIYLKEKPDGVLERPLKAETAQGPRVALARSDLVEAGLKFFCEIHVLHKSPVTEKVLRAILDYGALKGLGQNRNSSYGRFKYRLTHKGLTYITGDTLVVGERKAPDSAVS